MFISFEGGEGTGKTTQASELSRRLEREGKRVVLVHEPGSTALGNYLREWLKREKRADMPASAELLLFAAARAALVTDIIRPALKRPDTVVIADRYADSTTAYQGYGRRIPLKDIAVVNRLATDSLGPDLTFLLDCPLADALGRIDSVQTKMALDTPGNAEPGRKDGEGTQRFEQESLEFHERVRAGYLKIARRESARWHVLDASRSEDVVAEDVWQVVRERLLSQGGSDTVSGANLPLWPGEQDLRTLNEPA